MLRVHESLPVDRMSPSSPWADSEGGAKPQGLTVQVSGFFLATQFGIQIIFLYINKQNVVINGSSFPPLTHFIVS